MPVSGANFYIIAELIGKLHLLDLRQHHKKDNNSENGYKKNCKGNEGSSIVQN
jgi:hypothetical protein